MSARSEGSPARWLLAMAVLAAGGCATVVTPPADVARPVRVLLLDHGRHASLVLPEGGRLVRYAYGDWSWYALQRTGPGEAWRALFTASPAALGRRTLAPPPAAGAVLAQLRVGVERVHVLEVEQARAGELARRLDALFRAQAATRHYNRAYDLQFVRHPEPYRMSHNSNHVTAQWLRELGCDVSGAAMFSIWRIRAPGD